MNQLKTLVNFVNNRDKYIKLIVFGAVLTVLHTIFLPEHSDGGYAHELIHFVSALTLIWGLVGDITKNLNITLQPKNLDLRIRVGSDEAHINGERVEK